MIIFFVALSTCISQYCNCSRMLCCQWRVRARFKTTPLLAFSTYLLLSYNKFCITAFQPFKAFTLLTLVSANKTSVPTNLTFFLTHTESVLIFGKVVFYLVVILISLLPIFLLGCVQWMELCLYRVTFLWKYYPADKIGIFLDTFQGCYNDKHRFFASAYFIFRLALNLEYILTSNWSAQYSLQQITCVIMLLLLAAIQPYKNKLLNCLDIYLLSNLIIVVTLSQYLLQAQSSQAVLPFVLQSLMVFIPLVLVAIYGIWSMCRERLKRICMQGARHELIASVDIDDTQPNRET